MKPRQLIVAGAGFAGLLKARTLRKQYPETPLRLIERSSRCGGLVASPLWLGHRIERAANSILLTAPMEAYFRDLGVTWLPAKTRARGIWTKDGIKSWPLSAIETISLIRGVLTRRFSRAPESFREFSRMVVSDGARLESHLLAPMLNGIFASEPSTIDPYFLLHEKTPQTEETFWQAMRRSRAPDRITTKGMHAPQGGMEDLVRALEQSLRRDRLVSVELNTDAAEVLKHNPPSSDTRWTLCTPAYAAAKILNDTYPEVSQLLGEVQYVSLISVAAWFRTKQLFKSRVGVLVANDGTPDKQPSALGVLQSSDTFDGRLNTQDGKLVTVMYGGERHPEAITWSDQHIHRLVQDDIVKIYGVTPDDLNVEITRWPKALPRLDRSHRDRLSKLAALLSAPQLKLFGNYTGQVSLRGMFHSGS